MTPEILDLFGILIPMGLFWIGTHKLWKGEK